MRRLAAVLLAVSLLVALGSDPQAQPRSGGPGPGPVPSTGFGVDGGTNAQTISNPAAGAATINNNAEQVKIASLNAATTLTLPAISAIPSPTTGCIRVHDNGQITSSNTLKFTANVADSINSGSAGGNSPTYQAANSTFFLCATATHNWTLTAFGVPAIAAVSHQYLTSLSPAGVWGQSQPSGGDLSDLPANHNVITSTGSGLTSVAPGTNGNVLTSNGTDWTSAAAAGGGVTCPTGYTPAVLGDCIKRTTGSGVSSITFAVPSGYDSMTITCPKITNSANVVIYLQIDEGSGLIAGTNYSFAGNYALANGTFSGDAGDATKGFRVAYSDGSVPYSTSTVIKATGLKSGNPKGFHAIEARFGNSSGTRGGEVFYGSYNTDTNAVTNIGLVPDSGTFTIDCTARLDPMS